MNSEVVISIVALVFSAFSLYLAYRKSSHTVILRLKPDPNRHRHYLSVVNDSATAPIQIQAIGAIRMHKKVEWQDHWWDASLNKVIEFPCTIEARHGLEVGTNIFTTGQYAYIVQASCGRSYLKNHNLDTERYCKLVFRAILSRVSGGRLGFKQNYLHLNKHR